MSNHVIHVKSCHSCQIMSFMSNHVIHFKSCHSCQIMSFMSNHAIHDFSRNSVKSGGREGGQIQGLARICSLCHKKNRPSAGFNTEPPLNACIYNVLLDVVQVLYLCYSECAGGRPGRPPAAAEPDTSTVGCSSVTKSFFGGTRVFFCLLQFSLRGKSPPTSPIPNNRKRLYVTPQVFKFIGPDDLIHWT
jgi:hypothetical protein